MAGIQSSVGLISGIKIKDTVDQLIALAARPRDLLKTRTETLGKQQLAVTQLTAQVIGLQSVIQRLGETSLFDKRAVDSSNAAALSASATGTPAPGSYRFTPLRQAQAHQLISSGLASASTAVGEGEITIRSGGFVDRGMPLEELNGGAGVEPGKIRITDRSGTSEVIDLRYALTIDDVLEAINSSSLRVTAYAEGDHLRLVDNTGQSLSNLKVEQYGTGSTAADLGLAEIDVAAAEAEGEDIVRLYAGLSLDRLNDGNGVFLRKGVADLEVTFRDGSSPLEIDFYALAKGQTQSQATTSAANGANAQIQFTSVGSGENYDGYRFSFVDDEEVTAGNETVAVNTVSKRIVFHIDAGTTRALDVIAALNNDPVASGLFTAAVAAGGNGTGVVDVSDRATSAGGAIAYHREGTLGELLDTINQADPSRLQARLSESGDGIELLDLTSGSGTFSVASLDGGTVAEDLGLTRPAAGGTITGRRRIAGLKTVLLDSLAGGYGLGELGQLSVTDRSGATASVDLSAAETLADVIAAINAAGIGVTARVNDSRNGILLSDTTAGSGPLIVANGDATGTADKLRIAVDDEVSEVASGSLDVQTFHEQLALASLNQGAGIGRGSFLITDSSGRVGAVNPTLAKAETVGDIIDLINSLGIGVQARINDSGDGLLLVDTAAGNGTLTVRDVGSGTTATKLRIAGTAETIDLNGTPAQVIDGSMALCVSVDADDTLEDVAAKINAQGTIATASVFHSGGGTAPYRLSITSRVTGRDGELLVDPGALDLGFRQVVAATDALMLVGTGGLLATSSSNEFEGLIDGVTLSLQQASGEEVTVEVRNTNKSALDQIDLFVTQYNNLRDKLADLTFYDETQETVGVLFGSSETLRVDMDLARAITARYYGLGSIHSLAELGLSLNDQGKLVFDKQKFQEQYAESPEEVRQFFTQAERGAAARLARVAEQLTGEDNSVLVNRAASLERKIAANEERIARLNEALERQRERLLSQFYNLENVIAKLQTSLSALSDIKPLASLFESED